MFKRFSFLFVLIMAVLTGCTYTNAATNNALDISNKYFSFTMPNETKGTYTVTKENNGIYICEKISEKLGLGGFAFGLKIFESPKDYATMSDSKKLGELTDKNGIIYDMVLMLPREIYYGDGEEIERNYNRLYNFAENVEIKGVNGSKYVKGKGMNGEELYNEVLKKYKKAFAENWTSDAQYEAAGMSYVYYMMAKKNINLLDKIGYTYYDVNSDGIDELLIGEVTKGVIYDIYTMVNRKPTHVISGGDDNKLFVCNDVFLCADSSETKNDNTVNVFVLEKNSTELYPQFMFVYDKNKDKKNPWFVGYGNNTRLESVSKKDYKYRISTFNKNYKKFDFVPFGELK